MKSTITASSGNEEVTTSDSITKAFLLQYRDNIQNEMNLAFLRNAEAKKGGRIFLDLL